MASGEMNTGLSLVIYIVWRHFLLRNVFCFESFPLALVDKTNVRDIDMWSVPIFI